MLESTNLLILLSLMLQHCYDHYILLLWNRLMLHINGSRVIYVFHASLQECLDRAAVVLSLNRLLLHIKGSLVLYPSRECVCAGVFGQGCNGPRCAECCAVHSPARCNHG